MAFHEDFSRREEIKGSGNRGFGLTVGGILLAIAAARTYLYWGDSIGWFGQALFAVGIILVLAGLIAPNSLAILNRAWTKLGLLMFKVISPIILAAIFALVIVPTALIVRLVKRDLLKCRFDPTAKSYWIEREPPGPEPESMKNQF